MIGSHSEGPRFPVPPPGGVTGTTWGGTTENPRGNRPEPVGTTLGTEKAGTASGTAWRGTHPRPPLPKRCAHGSASGAVFEPVEGRSEYSRFSALEKPASLLGFQAVGHTLDTP
jgi:hypothetical protein